MNTPPSPRADRTDADRAAVKRLLLGFFAVVYMVEGVGQIGGLIAQPLLSFYLKKKFMAGPRCRSPPFSRYSISPGS